MGNYQSELDAFDYKASQMLSPLVSTGRTIYVSSVTGTASSQGTQPRSPISTIDAAIGLCTANKGDRIVVLPGHAETLSAASDITCDVAGVTIIGIGTGSLMPTLTYSATAATTVISAANVTISGIRFVAGIDNVAVFVTMGADWGRLSGCEFWGNATYQFINGVGITTTKDYAIIEGCKFWQSTDPAATNAAAGTGAIYLVDSEHVRIRDCEFNGYFETAFIHNKTTGAADLWVSRCKGICSLSDAQPFLLVSSATGGVEDSSFITPAEVATTEATLSGTFGAGYFNFRTYFGNDGGGGQLAIASQAAAS